MREDSLEGQANHQPPADFTHTQCRPNSPDPQDGAGRGVQDIARRSNFRNSWQLPGLRMDEDDLLLRALEGDVEAAVLLQKRQKDRRRHRRRRSEIVTAPSNPVAAAPVVVVNPHSHERTQLIDRLLTDALRGDGVWLQDGTVEALLKEFSLQKRQEDQCDNGDASLYATLARLHEQVSRHEKLEGELAAKSVSLSAIRQTVQELKLIRDDFLSQLANAGTSGFGGLVGPAARAQGQAHDRIPCGEST